MRWLHTDRWTKRHFARLRNGSKARDSRQEDYLASMDASTQDKIYDHKRESELQKLFDKWHEIVLCSMCVCYKCIPYLLAPFSIFLHLIRPTKQLHEQLLKLSSRICDFSVQMIFSLQMPIHWALLPNVICECHDEFRTKSWPNVLFCVYCRDS